MAHTSAQRRQALRPGLAYTAATSPPTAPRRGGHSLASTPTPKSSRLPTDWPHPHRRHLRRNDVHPGLGEAGRPEPPPEQPAQPKPLAQPPRGSHRDHIAGARRPELPPPGSDPTRTPQTASTPNQPAHPRPPSKAAPARAAAEPATHPTAHRAETTAGQLPPRAHWWRPVQPSLARRHCPRTRANTPGVSSKARLGGTLRPPQANRDRGADLRPLRQIDKPNNDFTPGRSVDNNGSPLPAGRARLSLAVGDLPLRNGTGENLIDCLTEKFTSGHGEMEGKCSRPGAPTRTSGGATQRWPRTDGHYGHTERARRPTHYDSSKIDGVAGYYVMEINSVAQPVDERD